jgi:hypothetical protein
MSEPHAPASRSAIRAALARLAYDRGEVRVANRDIGGCGWLAASHRGLFGIAGGAVRLLVHGWFYGLCRHADGLFLFENGGHRDREAYRGRILRIALGGDQLGATEVLVTELHGNCHQVQVIDGLLCVVDTANQAIRRYALDGREVDVRRPFPPAPPTDTSGAYLHVNTVARVDGRIGLVLHNGKAEPARRSEIAWLDADWRVTERIALPGHHCHDIVADGEGRTWHSLSQEGEVLRSDGVRLKVTETMMTRGIALSPDTLAVGTSTFGPRHLRGTLNGSVVFFDRATLARSGECALPGAPTDLLAL